MTITRLTRWSFVSALLLVSLHAFGVWNESIQVEGGNPDAMRGATVSFTLPSGDVVEGSVEEDDDGDPVLLFPIPGDKPSSGRLTIEDRDGQRRTYLVPAHDTGERLTLNLDTGLIASAGGVGASQATLDDRFSLRLAISGQRFDSDYLSDVIGGSVEELSGLLTDVGASGIRVPSSFDDDAYGYGVDLSLHYALSPPGSVYLKASWAESEDFDGRVNGSGMVGASNVAGDQIVESSLDYVSLIAGYEYLFADNWEAFGGLGWVWGDADLSFASSLSIDGQPINELSGSESEDWDASIIEVGMRHYLGFSMRRNTASAARRPPLSLSLSLRRAFDGPRGEDPTILSAALEYRF